MKIQVIIGATRPNRITERLAKWALAEAAKTPGFEVELVDLADYDMPLFNEPVSPRYNPNRELSEPVARFLAKVAEADGYIIATAEYNYSMPAVLKNAIDYLGFEFVRKPVLVVAHGTVGGARATEHLRSALAISGAIMVPVAIAMHGASELLDADGAFLGDTSNPYGLDKSLTKGLGELAWLTTALKPGRSAA
jgi:NAD(P)H-dependent FMN reductase